MNTCLSCVCCHSLMLVLELHAIIFFSLQQDFAKFSSTPCMVYRSFWASAPPLPALAARGNGPARRDWNTAVYLCVCLCVCVCVGGWQAICRLFTLYISLSGCCKSLSGSVHDHLPPGWITSAFLSFSPLVSPSVHQTINHRVTHCSVSRWCGSASRPWITFSPCKFWGPQGWILILLMEGVMLLSVLWCHRVGQRIAQSFPPRLPGDITYIIDLSLRCHFCHRKSVCWPEKKNEIKAERVEDFWARF